MLFPFENDSNAEKQVTVFSDTILHLFILVLIPSNSPSYVCLDFSTSCIFTATSLGKATIISCYNYIHLVCFSLQNCFCRNHSAYFIRRTTFLQLSECPLLSSSPPMHLQYFFSENKQKIQTKTPKLFL